MSRAGSLDAEHFLRSVSRRQAERHAEPVIYPWPLQSVEPVVPVGALMRELPSGAAAKEGRAELDYSAVAAESFEQNLLLLGRFLAGGNWFAAVATGRLLLEWAISAQEEGHLLRVWRESGARGPRPEALSPSFDAARAASLSDLLAAMKASYDLLSEALHGRGPIVALWLAKRHSL